jgi:hypothetical protein
VENPGREELAAICFQIAETYTPEDVGSIQSPFLSLRSATWEFFAIESWTISGQSSAQADPPSVLPRLRLAEIRVPRQRRAQSIGHLFPLSSTWCQARFAGLGVTYTFAQTRTT